MNRRDFLRLAALSGGSYALATSWRDATSAESAIQGSASPEITLKAKGNSLHYLVFGDWGANSPLQRDVAAAMVNYCRHARPKVDFAIAAGDNFYNNGISGITDEQWQLKFERMYPAHVMKFPFYAVLGNHDWHDNPTGQIAYSLNSSRWRMEGFYYKASAPNRLADFFFLDSNLWLPQTRSEYLGEKQTKWLDKALSESQARWKLCIEHHPPYTDGIHGKEKDAGIVRDVLTPLLDKHNVHALYSGHDHDLQHIQIEGKPTQFVVSGGGGGVLRKRSTHDYGPFYQDMTGGFLAVELGGTIKSKFIAHDGSVLHEWEQSAT